MKFHHILFQKFRFIGVLMLCLLFLGTIQAQKKAPNKVKATSINLHVTDESGKPISNAQVVVGEGIIHTATDAKGTVVFQAFPTDFVTISTSGYENVSVLVQEILVNNTIKLVKSKLYMSNSDNIQLPYMTVKKRNLTGAEKVITGNQLEKYPSTDLRNDFAGLVPGLDVVENYGIPGTSPEEKLGNFGSKERVSLSLRGRSPMYIIDDVPIDITEMQLDPQEIESVTVLKDIVAKTMYGPNAADGVIFIKTKRGKKNERILNVNAEYGMGLVGRFPGFTSGADYAALNNQARINSGLTPNYTTDQIAKYALNNPYDLYFPSSNYKDLILDNQRSFKRVNVASQGGNDAVQYYANLAYDGDGDIYKIGPAAGFNRLSTRANLDIRVNDLIKVKFDFYGGLSSRKSPNYGYDSNYGADNSDDGTMDIVEMDRLLGDINSINPIAFPVYANNDPSLVKPWYGITTAYPNNPVGRVLNNGYYTETGRSGNTSLTLNYDMKHFLKGLTSKTFLDFQALDLLRIGKAEDYTAYTVTPSKTATGADTAILTKVHDGVDMAGQAKLHDYYLNRFNVYQTFSYDRTFGKHALQSTLTYNLAKSALNGIEEPRRQQNAVLSAFYTYDDKYSIQASANYAGTYSFSRAKRFGLFPAVGLGWVVSDEKFMSGLKFIDFLKVRADVGKLGYEAYTSPYYYNTVYTYNTSGTKFGPAPTGYWFGSSEDKTQYQTYESRTGNPDLTWETRDEFSVGIEGLLLKHKLSFEVNYYNNLRDGIITQLSNVVPYVDGLSGAKPYYNYNKTRYTGIESSLQYNDKIGNVKVSLGGSATVQNSEIVKLDEPSYRNSYQSHVGQSADAYYGLVCIGKFATDEETLVVPQLYDAALHAGDLKYKDQNNDGFIDANDISKIGHTTPRLFYSVNLKVAYKNFDMTVIGTGRALYDIPMTNSYYWNGWGDNNYSNFVKENVGGAYPRLTYYQVSNNFQSSTFWLMKGGFFKVKNIEIAYTLPQKTAYSIAARGVRFFIRGANLLTITKVKDVDPESVNSGISSYPLFSTYTAGIKLTF
ncbi:MAG: SusC/RagA family TonB-linked outer membrane protein [Bacteroidota bacterium]|nr:SusC/RagA family TonB-linked outer membrane protein [Bacteroidota bacterium]